MKLSGRLSGTAALAAARIAAQVLQFGLFIAAARLLTTSEFGAFSLIFAAVVALTVVAEAGWREYAICCDRAQLPHVNTLAALSGTALAIAGLAGCLVAWAAGLEGRTLSAAFLLVGWIWLRPVTVVQGGVLTRDGRLHSVALVQFSAELTGFLAGVAALFLGQGLLALAIGKIAMQLVDTCLTAVLARSFAFVRPERTVYRDALRFSRHILGARILTFLQGNYSTLIIGVVHNPAQVGFYRAAVRIVGAAQETVREPARQLLWFSLGAARDADPTGKATTETALRYCELLCAIAGPLFIALAVFAPHVTVLILGAKWAPAGPIIAILAAAACVRLLASVVEPLLALKGRTDLVQRFVLATSLISAILLTAAVPFGLEAIAWSELASALVAMPIAAMMLRRHAQIGAGTLIRVLAPVLAGWVACLGAALLVHFSHDGGRLSLMLQLAVMTALVLLCHACVVLLSKRLLRRSEGGAA